VNVGCQLTVVVVTFPTFAFVTEPEGGGGGGGGGGRFTTTVSPGSVPRAVSAPDFDSVYEASSDGGRPQPSNTTSAPNMKSDAVNGAATRRTGTGRAP